ncbi:MAG: hypothetical protein ABI353_16290 [Isosphaeraceae bacterium]
MNRYALGRSLQFLGLVILPFAMASELVGAVGEGKLLLIALAGAVVFYIGTLVQPRAG